MYAVISSGGKQYRVQPGDVVQVEKLEGEIGAAVKFDEVLLVSKTEGEKDPQIWMGKPLLSGASVDAEIVGQGRGDKVTIIKMKRRKQYRRTQGHRQFYTQLLITGLTNGGSEKATLSSEDRNTTMAKFQTHLKPRGPAFALPKVRVRTAPKAAGEAAAPAKAKKPAASKAAAAGGEKKKAAPKKKA